MGGPFAPQLARTLVERGAIGIELTQDDLVASDDCFFAATGVTDGDVLQGVRYLSADRATTESLVTRSKTRTVRRIQATHNRAKMRDLLGDRYG